MDLLKILKFNVFLVSFAMFCYQLNIATINLMDPPTVDSTNERSITDDDMPLITVCPTNQTNLTRLAELGYGYSYDDSYDWMFVGNAKCNETTRCVSWGGHLNLTFDELKEQVFDLDKVESIDIDGGKFKDSPVFIPAYGLCKETSLLNYTQEIELVHFNPDDSRIFITDRNYRSFIMPDVASHVGKEIFMKRGKAHYINVKIQVKKYCNFDEKPMSEEEFTKCVNDKIQNEFEKNNISCIPPWLSYNKQCNQTYPYYFTFYGKLRKHLWNYVNMVGILSNIRFEEECRQSCKETLYVVKEKGSKKSGYNWASLTFNQKVFVTESVPNYDMFKYIIDVGSSLGLWLGLSVLGLHDLVVWAVQFVNNSLIIKKIRSAVTK